MTRPHWKIPIEDVPAEQAIHQYILQNTDLQFQIKKMEHKFQGKNFLSACLNMDFDSFRKDVLEGINKFGLYQFQYGFESSSSDDGLYLSSSLTFNPHAYDKISENPHQATLGSTNLKFNSASRYEKENGMLLRNSYHDTFAFIQKTPLAEHGALKKFLESFQRTIVRSRISSIVASKPETTKFGFNWHNDESIFINLRINIPIQTSSNYVIQIMDSKPEELLRVEEFSMEAGRAYVYNTEKYHRAVCKQMESFDRIHMICGVSPWFDFDEENRCWVSNEFYGEVHPFEMLEMGLISSSIKK